MNGIQDLDCGKLPSDAIIQAGACVGALFSDGAIQVGTLGCRVTREPNNHYLFLTSQHTFQHQEEFSLNDALLIDCESAILTQQSLGRVISEKYSPYVWNGITLPSMDAAVIQTYSTTPRDIAGGLFNNVGKQLRIDGSQTSFQVGDEVLKYGVGTGYTEGKIYELIGNPVFGFLVLSVDLSTKLLDPWNSFGLEGDSGATVFRSGSGGLIHPVGMLTKGFTLRGVAYTYAISMDALSVAMNVSVSSDV